MPAKPTTPERAHQPATRHEPSDLLNIQNGPCQEFFFRQSELLEISHAQRQSVEIFIGNDVFEGESELTFAVGSRPPKMLRNPQRFALFLQVHTRYWVGPRV